MFKKLIAFILTASLVFGLLPVGALASDYYVQTDTYGYSNVTTNSATVSGQIYQSASGINILYYGIEYSENSSFYNSQKYNAPQHDFYNSPRYDFSVGLNNLKPNTQYYYRTFCEYSIVGSSGSIPTYGNSNWFSTSSSGSTSTTVEVNPPRISDVDDTSAFLETSFLPSNSNTGSVLQVGFVWSTTNTNPMREHVSSGSALEWYEPLYSSGYSFSKKIQSLDRSKDYYIRAFVTVQNSFSSPISMYSSVVKLEKVSAVMPEIVTENISNVQNNKADVTINLISDRSNAVVEKGVVYSNVSSNPMLLDYNTNYAVAGTSSKQTVTLSNLTSGKTYYVKAYAKTTNSTVYYGSVLTFTAGQNQGNIPAVSTVSYQNITDNSAEVTLEVTNYGTGTITEKGIVYSDVNQTPFVDTSNNYVKVTADMNAKTNVTLTGLTTNRTYYVRAYVKSTQGIYYGSPLTFVARYNYSGSPTISIDNINNVNVTGADIVLDIKTNNATNITEKGVVYSLTKTVPELNGSETSNKTVSGTSDKPTIVLNNLETNRTYYVRGYIKNSTGTFYSEAKNFTTRNEFTVDTTQVKDITPITAVIVGKISSNSSYTLVEKGFVLSKTDKYPTVNDIKVGAYSSTADSYSMEATGLDTNTSYYVRAYAKTSSSISYGNMLEFTTGGGNVQITINYKTTDMRQVSEQTITSSVGSTLTTKDLKVPTGYSLFLTDWSYTVKEKATITIAVNSSGDQEKVFMEGVGAYKFEPSRAATRAEVAQVLFNLSSDKSVSTPMTFTDVAITHSAKAAIDFVSSKKYFQGYPDGSFKPNNPITRAEMCVILSQFYKLSGASKTPPFTDVKKTDWHYNFVNLAYNNNIFNGYPDNTFKPGNSITRAEVCTVFSFAEDRTLTPLGSQEFTDVPSSHWAYKYIMNASIPRP